MHWVSFCIGVGVTAIAGGLFFWFAIDAAERAVNKYSDNLSHRDY